MKRKEKNNMETRKRDYAVTVLGVLLFVAGLVLLKAIPEAEGMMKALPYLCVGVGCGMLGHGIGIIMNGNIMKKNPELKKQKQIAEQDERNVMLSATASAKAYRMATYVFNVLLLSYALMNVEILPILMLAAGYLFVVGYGIWYRLKLEKLM